MDTPLLPKEMGRGPKMALLGVAGITMIAVIVGIALCIFELGLREFETPWIVVGGALFVLLMITVLFYKWVRTDEDYDDNKYLYVLGVQFVAIVIFGCALYGIAFPPTETNYYFIGGVIDGVKGTGGEITLSATGEKLNIQGDSCRAFHFKKKVAGGKHISLKILQPSLSECHASGASGSMKGNMNKISVHCDPSWAIGGTVIGATNAGMVMTCSGQNLEIPPKQDASQSFTFKNRVKNGSKYSVTVKSVPTSETCGSVAHGEGTATADVSDISVKCVS